MPPPTRVVNHSMQFYAASTNRECPHLPHIHAFRRASGRRCTQWSLNTEKQLVSLKTIGILLKCKATSLVEAIRQLSQRPHLTCPLQRASSQQHRFFALTHYRIAYWPSVPTILAPAAIRQVHGVCPCPPTTGGHEHNHTSGKARTQQSSRLRRCSPLQVVAAEDSMLSAMPR